MWRSWYELGCSTVTVIIFLSVGWECFQMILEFLQGYRAIIPLRNVDTYIARLGRTRQGSVAMAIEMEGTVM